MAFDKLLVFTVIIVIVLPPIIVILNFKAYFEKKNVIVLPPFNTNLLTFKVLKESLF